MDKLKTIVKVLDEKLAEDIVVIDMSIDSPICDYFVIASASNERLLLALKDHIEDACDKEGYYVKDYDEENDEDDFYFHWHVDRISKGYVKHSVEIIDKVENDRVYEEHYQKTYDVETYIELLEKIGFKNIKLYSDFSKYDTECERVIFICQKG